MSNASQHPGRSCQLGHHPKLVRGKHCPCSQTWGFFSCFFRPLTPTSMSFLPMVPTPQLQMCRIDAVIKGGRLTFEKLTESVTGVPFHMPEQRLKPCCLSEGLSKGHLPAQGRKSQDLCTPKHAATMRRGVDRHSQGSSSPAKAQQELCCASLEHSRLETVNEAVAANKSPKHSDQPKLMMGFRPFQPKGDQWSATSFQAHCGTRGGLLTRPSRAFKGTGKHGLSVCST